MIVIVDVKIEGKNMSILSLFNRLSHIEVSNDGKEKEAGWTWLSGMVVMVAHVLLRKGSQP